MATSGRFPGRRAASGTFAGLVLVTVAVLSATPSVTFTAHATAPVGAVPEPAPAPGHSPSVALIAGHHERRPVSLRAPLLRSGQSVNPSAFYGSEPAPVGIADYGIDGSGGAYSYNTTTFVGEVQFGNISVRNRSLSYGREFTIQLNVVLQFSRGASSYDFWIQDVVDFNTSNHLLVLIDNVWNFSGSGAALPSSTFSGNGTFVASPSYYYDVASASLPGNWAITPFPAMLGLRVVSTDPTGAPRVAFEYNDTGRWVTYDNLVFGWANGGTDSGFVVTGRSYNPAGLFNDAELTFGGPGGGAATEAFGLRANVNLLFWNGHNYQKVLNAYNHGSDTAEAIWNVTDRGFHYVSNGTVYGYLTGGGGTLGRLYSRSLVSLLNVSLPFSRGELYLNGTDYGPFVGGDANVTVGPGFYDVSVDQNGSLFAARNVSVPAAAYVPVDFRNSPKYGVSFSETGLPAGRNWTVTFGGTPRNSTANVVNFTSTNGTVAFQIGVPAGYSATPSSGTVLINGANRSVTVSVHPVVYPVTFSESGLPAGSNWSITVNGSLLSGTTVGLQVREPNGSFPFAVGRFPGFQASPELGNVVVDGAARFLTIAFSRVTYAITFQTVGLGAGVRWAIGFAGLNYSSNQSAFAIVEPNGTYALQVSPIPGYYGPAPNETVTVAGAPTIVDLTFRPAMYPLYVNTTGLPPGTAWQATLDGWPVSESTPNAVFDVANGTHSVRVGLVPGFITRTPIRTADVRGAAASMLLGFSPFTYPVTFGGTGLPAGASWSVTVSTPDGSYTNSSAGTLISFDLPNGSFQYSFSGPTDYSAVPPNGTGQVAAGPVGIEVAFAPEIGWVVGTVSPQGATVTVNSTVVSLVQGGFNLSLPPGTYQVRAAASGFAPWSETITISGGNVSTVRIELVPTSATSSGPDGPPLWSWVVVGLGAVIVVGVVAARRRRGRSP